MAIGDRIHELRAYHILTMEELGQKIGVGKGTIKKYENGTIKNIPSDKIEALAEALETTPEYLMGWTNVAHNPPQIQPPAKTDGQISLNPAVKRIISLAHEYPDMTPEQKAYIDGAIDFLYSTLNTRFEKGSAEDDPKL